MTNTRRQDKQVCLIFYQTLIPHNAAKTVFMLSLHLNSSWTLKGVGFWLKAGVVSVEFSPVNIGTNCTTVITSFPVMKEARSRLVWPTFSCSRAKIYISERACSTRGTLTWLSCQKLRRKKKKKTSPITSLPGPEPWGNPSTGEGDARAQQH